MRVLTKGSNTSTSSKVALIVTSILTESIVVRKNFIAIIRAYKL
jgi:hypothetical protein